MPNLLPLLLIGLTWSTSLICSYLPFLLVSQDLKYLNLLCVITFPAIFIFIFITTAGILSKLGVRGVKKGKFPRELFHPVYVLRRIYGTCWTTVYYFKPLYHVALTIPILKKWMLKLFGYKGATQFTVYPDTWIRDLPLLAISKGVYLANRATIGTNMCLTDGHIFVDIVRLDQDSMVGHLAVIGPGVKLGEKSEVGVGTTIGIKARVSINCRIGVQSMIDHGVVLDEGVYIGTSSHIGLRSHIGKGVKLPAGSNIPAGSVILTQEEMQQFYTSETKTLQEHKKNALRTADQFIPKTYEE